MMYCGHHMQFLFSITWGTVSGWWVPACFALGILYAWLLYRLPVNLANKFRYWLFAFRAIVVTIIALVLLSPLVKSVNYNPQKPLVLVLEDNSQSVQMFKSPLPGADNFVDGLSTLKKELGADYDVQEFHFNADLA